MDRVSPGKWVWVTETGWPVSGANFGAGVASVKNARKLKHAQPEQTNVIANPVHRNLLAQCLVLGRKAGAHVLVG